MTFSQSRDWIRAAVLAGVIIACDRSGSGEKSAHTDTTRTSDSSLATQLPPGLRLTIESRDSVPVGQSVEIAVVLSNVTRDSTAVSLGYVESQPRAVVRVYDVDGTLVWDSSERGFRSGRPAGREVQAVLNHGEALRAVVTWDGRDLEGAVLPPGDYVMRGTLFTLGRAIEAVPRSLRLVTRAGR